MCKMTVRERAAFFLILSSIAHLSAQPQPVQAAIQKVVSVNSVKIKTPLIAGSPQVPIEVQLQNISDKSIYAFKIKGVASWPDGSTKPIGTTADLLGEYYNWDYSVPQEDIPPGFKKPSIFRAGQTYTLSLSANLAKGAAPTAASLEVTAVAFGDRTALGSHDEIQKILTLRVRQVEQLGATIGDLEGVMKANDPIEAAAARAKELRAPQPGDPNIGDGKGNRISPREGQATRLTNQVNSAQGDKGRIAKSIAYHQGLVELLKAQSSLDEVNQ
jgi:hypothetical protein